MTTEKIPQERLNEIADRRLAELGVATSLSPDRKTLRGQIRVPAGAVRNPISNEDITVLDFVVVGHDRLRILNPPIASEFGAIHFYNHETLDPLFAQLRDAIARRSDSVRTMRAKLSTLGLNPQLEPTRGLCGAFLELAGVGRCWLESNGDRLRIRFAIPVGMDDDAAIPLDIPVDLFEINDRTDLDLALASLVERGMDEAKKQMASRPVAPRRTAAAPAAPPAPPELPTIGEDDVTVGMVGRKLGADAILGSGLNISRDFVVGMAKVRFTAVQKQGRRFAGKIIGPGGILWQGQFQIDEPPDVSLIIAKVLEEQGLLRDSQAAAPAASHEIAKDTGAWADRPVVGEAWVMNVIVEKDDGQEVRYTAVDTQGRPFGSTRVLPKAAFHETFVAHGAGYRLMVLVIGVNETQVAYSQLNAARQPVGQQRIIDLPAFTSTFVAEAAAY